MTAKREAYEKYKKATNMSCSEIKEWSKNPCSKKASIGRTAIKRNIRLQCKPLEDWTKREVKDANKAVSYLARAKKIKSKNKVKGCGMTKNEIALKNWAFDKV